MKARLMSLLTVVVLIATQVPAADPVLPGGAAGAQSADTGGLRLTASVERSTVRPGNMIELTLTLENVGKDVIRIPTGAISRWFEFVVLSPTDETASLTLYGQRQLDAAAPGSVSVSPLGPGERSVTTIPLSRLYDMTLDGKYQITARRRVSADVVATSNTLTVTVGDVPSATMPTGGKQPTGMIRSDAPESSDPLLARQEEFASRIKAACEKKDIAAMAALGREIETLYRPQNAAVYSRLMWEIASQLTSYDFGTLSRFQAAQDCAMRALSKGEVIPLFQAIKLAFVLQPRIFPEGATAEEQAQLRRTKTTYWLQAWSRMNKAIDRQFNFAKEPMLNVPLPDPALGVAGIAPEGIRDPVLRAKYAKDIAENKAYAERYSLQYHLKWEEPVYVRQGNLPGHRLQRP